MNEISKEEWRETKEAERKQLMERRQAAITKALSSGENLAQYLAGRGRLGSRYSSGNAALILDQNPKARAVKSLEEWASLGRRIGRGEHGIQIIGREDGYWRVQRVFELTQTYGPRPCKLPRLSANEPKKLEAALDTLVSFSPVTVTGAEQPEAAARYVPETNEIVMDLFTPQEKLFEPLAAAIVTVNICPGEEPSQTALLYGKCAAAELCGRFGLELSPATVQELNTLLPQFTPGEERAMLDEIGEFARKIGSEIEKEVFPPERGRVPVEMSARNER